MPYVAPRLQTIIHASAERFGVTYEQIIGKSRFRSIALARLVAMRLGRDEGRWSYPELGMQFQRDHSTVMAACRHVARLLVNDERFWHDFEAVREAISERPVKAENTRMRVAV